MIWKFTLGVPNGRGISRIDTDSAKILEVLSFGEQDAFVVCWALVRPEVGYVDTRRFLLVNTGTEGDYEYLLRGRFLETVRVPVGDDAEEIVWHIFEVKGDA